MLVKKWIVVFYLIVQGVVAQTIDYPKDFSSPMDIPLELSATFGELRHNHFHSGIDFKTQQKEGLNVLATADGFVSRIKISVFGYGKAIYITHSNGYTSVYGHIQKFSPKIEAYLKDKQYQKKSYEIELFPKAKHLPIAKGELIGYSGNSGSSGGPHLHFEYRETKTEHTINPFYFGLDKNVADTKSPIVAKLLAYPQNDSSAVNLSQLPVEITLMPQKDGTYMAEPVYAKGLIGFGIDAYDIADASRNRNGLYKIETFLNGETIYHFLLDKFSFDETRYINAFIDYNRYIEKDYRVQKLFVDNSIKLSLIKKVIKNGFLNIVPNVAQVYRIELTDFHQNKTIVYVPVFYEDKPLKITKPTLTKKGFLLKHKIDNQLTFENVEIYIPENTFYNDVTLEVEVKNDVLKLHNPTIPVHSNMTLSFDLHHLKPEQKKGICLVEVKGEKTNYVSSKIIKQKLQAKIRTLGNYKLANDTIAPVVKMKNVKEGENIGAQNTLVFEVKDDLSGVAEFNGFLNGDWILLEYDFKTNSLTYFDEDLCILPEKNEIKIIVKDNVGNSSILETNFIKQ